MAEIKSALELAMERVQDVKVDKEGLRLKELKAMGKRLISAFLNDNSGIDEVTAELDKHIGDDLLNLRRGALEAMMSNLVLPQGPVDSIILAKLETGLSLVTGQADEMQNMFQQVRAFFEQYDQSKEQLREALKAQMLPKLQARAQETGVSIGEDVDPERFPEFGKIYSENLLRVNEQFQPALDEMKEHLVKLIG